MDMFENSFWSPVKLSLEVSALSVLIVLLFGIVVARVMSKAKFSGKVLVDAFLLLPIVLPPTVIGFLLVIIFGNHGPVGLFVEKLFHQTLMFTFWAAVIASTVVAFPLMYQTVRTGFESIDSGIEEAARVDGASELKVFLYVTLPLSLRAIISGGILSFARALGEFGATFMFAGNIPGKTQTAPVAIYAAMESGNMKMAWAWVAAMIIISLFMLFSTNFIRKS
jgi:molybdate transport system permease protein